jgi:hypothetical protein
VDIFELQWYNCDGVFTKIPGEDKSFFIPTKPGKYSVLGKSANCSAYSNCLQVIVTNEEDPFYNDIKIYPNPANDKLILESDYDSEINIDIYNLLGIKENSFFSRTSENVYEIEIKDVSAGNKIIKITNRKGGKTLLKPLLVVH